MPSMQEQGEVLPLARAERFVTASEPRSSSRGRHHVRIVQRRREGARGLKPLHHVIVPSTRCNQLGIESLLLAALPNANRAVCTQLAHTLQVARGARGLSWQSSPHGHPSHAALMAWSALCNGQTLIGRFGRVSTACSSAEQSRTHISEDAHLWWPLLLVYLR